MDNVMPCVAVCTVSASRDLEKREQNQQKMREMQKNFTLGATGVQEFASSTMLFKLSIP